MTAFPRWLSTERSVGELFRLYGFEVESVSIDGRQIDVLAHRADTFGFDPETWVIEITLERVDAEKGSKDYQKLALAKSKTPNAHLMLISTAGFTADQKATLKSLGVIAKEFTDFEDHKVNLRQYALAQIHELQGKGTSDIGYSYKNYIAPELTLQPHDGRQQNISSELWIAELLRTPTPSVCALLGNLGSGKTSLLQHALGSGCKAFLEDPNMSCLPLYVPLGQYKQHSGDIDQMLMGEFRRIGQQTYPAAVIRHLIATRRLILLLDGLDEIHPIQNSNDVLDTITRIISGLGHEAAAVITCRKHFFESSQEELAYFGPYTAGHLEDLQAGLAKALRGYPTTCIASINPFDKKRIESYLSTRCRMTSEEVAQLFATYYGFEDMAQTPVLLAMIATTAEEGLVHANVKDDFPLLSLYEAYTNRWLERDVGRARLRAYPRTELHGR